MIFHVSVCVCGSGEGERERERTGQSAHLDRRIELLLMVLLELAPSSLLECLQRVDVSLNLRLIFLPELPCDDVQILDGINPVLHVNDIRVFETPANVENAVDGTDIRQECITQARTLAGALDEPGNVDHLEKRGHLALGLVHALQPVETLIGNVHARDIRLDLCNHEDETCVR